MIVDLQVSEKKLSFRGKEKKYERISLSLTFDAIHHISQSFSNANDNACASPIEGTGK